MVAHDHNPWTYETEAKGSLLVWLRPGSYSKFQASQSYIAIPYLKSTERERERRERGPRICPKYTLLVLRSLRYYKLPPLVVSDVSFFLFFLFFFIWLFLSPLLLNYLVNESSVHFMELRFSERYLKFSLDQAWFVLILHSVWELEYYGHL